MINIEPDSRVDSAKPRAYGRIREDRAVSDRSSESRPVTMLLFGRVWLARREGFEPSTLRSEVLEHHTPSLMIRFGPIRRSRPGLTGPDEG